MEDHLYSRMPCHDQSHCAAGRHPVERYWTSTSSAHLELPEGDEDQESLFQVISFRKTSTSSAHLELPEGDEDQESLFQVISFRKIVFELLTNLSTLSHRWNQLLTGLENTHFSTNNSLASLQIENNLLAAWTGPVTSLDKVELNLYNNIALV